MADKKLTGIGSLGAAPDSSDLFHVVDVSDTTQDPAGSSKKVTYSNFKSGITKTDVGLSNVEDLLNNTTTTDPAATDDSGSGYAVGSRWRNTTNDTEFVCLDDTATAAVWKETTSTGVTNLGYTASDTDGTVTSDTGTDATLPLATPTGGSNEAGLLSPGDKDKLDNTSGTNTGDQTITLTGDVAGSGTGSFAATIADDAVTNAKQANMSEGTVKARTSAGAGDPEDVDIDTTFKTSLNLTKGDVGLSNVDNVQQQPLDSDLTSIAGLTPTDNDIIQRKSGSWTNRTVAEYKADLSLGTMADENIASLNSVTMASAANISFSGGGEPTGLPSTPSGATAAISKAFFDSQSIKGAITKANVIVATTGSNITLSGEQTIDGVLTSASRVLVKDQTNATENGIYVSDSGAWARSEDLDNSPSAEIFNGVWTYVASGTANTGLSFRITSTGTGTDGLHQIGTDNINWQEQAIDVVGGDGITKTGQTLSVDYNTTNLKITANQIDTIQSISSSASPSFTGISLTNDLAVSDGGTGASNQTDARSNLGLTIGTDVQAFDTELNQIAGITFSKGDLISHTGSAIADLPVGTNNQFLMANSSESTGLQWVDGGLQTAYEETFNNSTDWTGPSGGFYTLTVNISSATHGKGVNIQDIEVWEDKGSNVFEKIGVDQADFNDSTGAVTVVARAAESPDGRFGGKIFVQGIDVGAGDGYATVQEDGSALNQRSIINFGNGLTASDDAGNSRTNVSLDIASGQALGTATTLTADGTYQGTNHRIAMPSAGTYLISYQVIFNWTPGSGSDGINVRLRNTTQAATLSGSINFTHANNGTFNRQPSISGTVVATGLAASDVIEIECAATSGATTFNTLQQANAETFINYVKLSD